MKLLLRNILLYKVYNHRINLTYLLSHRRKSFFFKNLLKIGVFFLDNRWNVGSLGFLDLKNVLVLQINFLCRITSFIYLHHFSCQYTISFWLSHSGTPNDTYIQLKTMYLYFSYPVFYLILFTNTGIHICFSIFLKSILRVNKNITMKIWYISDNFQFVKLPQKFDKKDQKFARCPWLRTCLLLKSTWILRKCKKVDMEAVLFSGQTVDKYRKNAFYRTVFKTDYKCTVMINLTRNLIALRFQTSLSINK